MKKFIAVIILFGTVAGAGICADISSSTLDGMLDWFDVIDGNLDTALGISSDTTTIKGAMNEILTDITGDTDADVLRDLTGESADAIANATEGNMAINLVKNLVRAIDVHIRLRRGTTNYANVDEYLTYYGIKVKAGTQSIFNACGVQISDGNLE